jgi:hypothetical protein
MIALIGIMDYFVETTIIKFSLNDFDLKTCSNDMIHHRKMLEH